MVCCEKEDKGTPTSNATDAKQNLLQSDTTFMLQKINPNSMLKCDDGRNQVSTTYWEDEYQFRSIASKSIGVMYDGDMSRIQNYFTQYGCKMVCVGSPNSISQLLLDGYALKTLSSL